MFWAALIAFGVCVALTFAGLYLPAALVVVAYFMLARRVVAARRLATLSMLGVATENGLPLGDAFGAYAENFRGGRRRKLLRFAGRLAEGATLPQAVKQTPGLLTERGRLAFLVGGETGTTAESVASAAALEVLETRRQLEDRSHVEIYLSAVIYICFGCFSFLQSFVVPKYRGIFSDFDTEMPEATTWFINHSESYLEPNGVGPGVFWSLVFYFWVWRRRDEPRVLFGLFGLFQPKRFSAEILRLLAVTAEASKPTVETLEAVATHHRNRWIRRRMRKAAARVRDGGAAWDALRDAGVIGRRQAATLAAAERSDTLPETLRRLADRRDDDDRHRRLLAAEYARPVVLAGLAVLIAVVAVAMFGPVVQLIDDLA